MNWPTALLLLACGPSSFIWPAIEPYHNTDISAPYLQNNYVSHKKPVPQIPNILISTIHIDLNRYSFQLKPVFQLSLHHSSNESMVSPGTRQWCLSTLRTLYGQTPRKGDTAEVSCFTIIFHHMLCTNNITKINNLHPKISSINIECGFL